MHAASLNSRRGIVALLVGAVASLAGACGLFSEPGLVVYTAGEEGQRDIVIVGTDGAEVATSLAHEADDFGPVWSPNRQSIAFLSDRDGNVELYIAGADGGSVLRATNTGVPESQPTWSPEGDRLAYTSPDGDGKPQIYWLRLSDLIPHRLQFRSESESDPAWSPKGVWIAFASLDADGRSLGLSLRNPDGVDELRISQSPDRSPVWSPDGRRIAFLSDRGESLDILTVSDGGEDLRELTRNDIAEVAVRWGADGRIVFESQPLGLSALFIVDADGTQQQLTHGTASASQPNW